MSAEERHLREMWRERVSAEASESCPDPERVWRAVSLELPVSERRELVEHVARCARCAESWRLAAGLVESPVSQVGAHERSWVRLPQLALAAASIVVAVGLGWFVLQREPPDAAVRTPGSAITSLLEDGQELPRDRFLLRWSAGPSGTIYDVEVATVDLKLLARGIALTEPEYLVSEDVLEDLPAGASIAWRVEATLPDGSVVASVTQFNSVR